MPFKPTSYTLQVDVGNPSYEGDAGQEAPHSVHYRVDIEDVSRSGRTIPADWNGVLWKASISGTMGNLAGFGPTPDKAATALSTTLHRLVLMLDLTLRAPIESTHEQCTDCGTVYEHFHACQGQPT